MNKKVYFALAVLVLVALACGINSGPTPTPAGNNGAMQVLFKDDFSDVNSGWDRTTNASGTTDYVSGGYRINVIDTDTYFFANPYQSFQNDVRIEVDATKAGGPDDNAFGVQCRYQDTKNYYYFYISSDGYAGIGIDNAGTKTIISSSDGNLVSDSHINQGAATNHIRADCIGSNLSLYVNGTQTSTATDSTFTGGDVGLVAKTFKVAGTDILFQNFVVYKP
jgi:hypothetical protein